MQDKGPFVNWSDKKPSLDILQLLNLANGVAHGFLCRVGRAPRGGPKLPRGASAMKFGVCDRRATLGFHSDSFLDGSFHLE